MQSHQAEIIEIDLAIAVDIARDYGFARRLAEARFARSFANPHLSSAYRSMASSGMGSMLWTCPEPVVGKNKQVVTINSVVFVQIGEDAPIWIRRTGAERAY